MCLDHYKFFFPTWEKFAVENENWLQLLLVVGHLTWWSVCVIEGCPSIVGFIKHPYGVRDWGCWGW